MKKHDELIRKLAYCAAACETCMDSCLDEEDIAMMVQCIRLDRDCSKMCHITASFVASNSEYALQMVRECEKICRDCAQECGRHDKDHCKQCAQACIECAEACGNYQGVAA